MVTTGIIKDIKSGSIFVELFNSHTPEDKSSCASGNCASCSAAGNTKLIEALNTRNLPVKPGSMIEMEISSSRALFAAFRLLLLPLVLFAAAFIAAGSMPEVREGFQVASGFAGLAAGVLLNLLLARKNRQKDMPEIVKIL